MVETKEIEKEGIEPQLYEVGYHLVPTIAEEAVAEEASKIKESIVATGGIMASEEIPKKMSLAYKVSHITENRRVFFDSAYFGWMKFHMPARELESLEQVLKENTSVLRYITLKASAEKPYTASTKKMTFFSPKPISEEKKEKKLKTMSELSKNKKEPLKNTLSEEDLDKTIEELITE